MIHRLSVSNEAEILAVHDASLAILRDVGVQIPKAEVLRVLAEAGAGVDFSQQAARIPEEMVAEALDRAGKQFILYGRDKTRVARFGYGDFVLVSSPGQFSWVEEDGAARRDPTSEDARQGILVGDALEHITIVGALGMALDIPTAIRDVWMAAELVKGTSKPTHVWVANGTTLRYILEIYEAVMGSAEAHRQYPMIAGFVEPISPLRFAETGLEILVTCARYGLPLFFAPMVQAAATGPATLAGTLALENAEILAGIVIAQLFGPGCPVCYGGIPHIMDMRTLQISFGSPEQGLMAVAMTQMAHTYGLPVYINVGLSDSKRVDAQSGLERGMTLLMGALAGADTFGHMGILGADQAASLEQLIVDNEMAAYVRRVLRGFAVNEQTIALEVIKRVGIGGNFLADKHTVAHFREELWLPGLFDRRDWQSWWDGGAQSMVERAREKKRRILSQHSPEPIDPALAREIDGIVAAARRELISG
ncbi:MAG: trimethylamine methyltransferase family protein [Anaerolineae bacterium]|nr:trimethylamine methyltransferase family protein [Anaerolineae bacterium]